MRIFTVRNSPVTGLAILVVFVLGFAVGYRVREQKSVVVTQVSWDVDLIAARTNRATRLLLLDRPWRREAACGQNQPVRFVI